MARFSVEDEYIHPDEFLRSCSNTELKELFRLLMFDYGFDEKDKDRPRSIGQINFNKHLDYLRENWFSISNEDIKIIATLAKKYGAF